MARLWSGKDGGSWSRDGSEGGLLANRPLELDLWQSPVSAAEKAVGC
jgi:hypothetical protein